MLIGSVAWYGVSCTSVTKCRNWLGLINVSSMSFIYKDSLKTNMYCLHVVDVNPVAAVIIGMFVMGLNVSENGATSHELSVLCMTVQFLPTTVVSACDSSSVSRCTSSLDYVDLHQSKRPIVAI